MNLYWVWHHNELRLQFCYKRLSHGLTNWLDFSMQLDLYFNYGNWFWQTSVSFYGRTITPPPLFLWPEWNYHHTAVSPTGPVWDSLWLFLYCPLLETQTPTANASPSNPMLSNAPALLGIQILIYHQNQAIFISFFLVKHYIISCISL